MTAVNRATLYSYFLTGLKPTQAQFANLIDSNLNIATTSAQSIASNISVSGNAGIGTNAGTSLLTLRKDQAAISYVDFYNTTDSISAAANLRLITENSTSSGTTSVDIIHYKTGLFQINNGDSAGTINLTANGTRGVLVASTGATSIKGTTTNDSASAGDVGEYISSTVLIGSAVALSSGVAANITSISLTAGDWDVSGSVWTSPAGGTTSTLTIGGISTTSATQPTFGTPGGSSYINISTGAGAGLGLGIAPTRISIASTTTVYLVTTITFAVSTMSAYGGIAARRAR